MSKFRLPWSTSDHCVIQQLNTSDNRRHILAQNNSNTQHLPLIPRLDDSNGLIPLNWSYDLRRGYVPKCGATPFR